MDDFTEQETAEDYYDEENLEEEQQTYSTIGIRSQLLTIIQLIVCSLILISAFAVKLIGGEIYGTVGTWFYDNYNDSIFTGTNESNFNFSDLVKFNETSTISPDIKKTENKENTFEDTIKNLSKSAVMPLKSGITTSPYGERDSKNHKGIDIGADEKSEICSMFDGKVIISENDKSYGNYIVISHDNGVKTLYAHCSELLVKKDDTIKAGQKIGIVGETGDADGIHLHLEIIVNGENIDPQKILGGEYT